MATKLFLACILHRFYQNCLFSYGILSATNSFAEYLQVLASADTNTLSQVHIFKSSRIIIATIIIISVIVIITIIITINNAFIIIPFLKVVVIPG